MAGTARHSTGPGVIEAKVAELFSMAEDVPSQPRRCSAVMSGLCRW